MFQYQFCVFVDVVDGWVGRVSFARVPHQRIITGQEEEITR